MSRLFRQTLTIGANTLLSRVLGFVRDMVLARVFGAGPLMDAFLVAFRIPNFFRRLFAEGAFALAFVPVLAEVKERQGLTAVRALVNAVAGTLGGVLILVSGLGAVAAPLLVWVFAPGFADTPGQQALTADMLRWTFPYLFFISLVAFAGGVLNTYGRFALPAFAPVLLNLCLISGALWLAPLFDAPVMALAIMVFVAGLAQLLLMLPGLAGLGLLPRPRWDWRDSGVRRILGLMGPAVLGSSVAQINLLFDTLLASFLAAGSVSWLYYSDRLVEFPLGVFGIALSTAILPRLSRRHAGEDAEGFSRTLDQALRWVVMLGLPAALGLVLLAGPMLTTLFQYGSFTAHDVSMARWSLMAYALGLPAFIAVKVLAPGFYARQDTRTPVRIAIRAMLANMALNLLCVLGLLALAFDALHTGLALATSASAYLNAFWLWRGLHVDGVYSALPGWGAVLRRVALGLGLMIALLWWLTPAQPDWQVAPALQRAVWLAGLIGLAMVGYFAVQLALGTRPRELFPRRR